jgi:hypothetical protein
MSFVVPTTLASASDYATWVGGPVPSNIDSILRSCSGLVLDAAEGAIYDTDPLTGLATDMAVKNALRDATCIQAQAWVTLNIDPATGGVVQTSKTARSKKIGSASIEYADAEVQAVAAARAEAYSGLVPEAARFLQQRNLLGTNPMVIG